MAKRIKILTKKIKGLEIQEKKHLEKLETLKGDKDTTPAYWQKEITQFKKQREKLQKKLDKISGRKDEISGK